MITVSEYLSNPCGTLSIPYWKNRSINLPEGMKIVHQNEWNDSYLTEYDDEIYFRLYHSLENVDLNVPDDFYIKTANGDDTEQIVAIINQSYTYLTVNSEQIEEYTKSNVYDGDLWILVYDKNTNLPIGCGIADYDAELKEGILEWIQVLPDYRGKKIGQFIVNQLLVRMVGKASFATVAGKTDNETKPEMLYRKCGFSGSDIWHVLRAKQV